MTRFWLLSLPMMTLWPLTASGLVIAASARAIATPQTQLSPSPLSEAKLPPSPRTDNAPVLALPPTPRTDNAPVLALPPPPFPNVWQLATDPSPPPPPDRTIVPPDVLTSVSPQSSPLVSELAWDAAPNPDHMSPDMLITDNRVAPGDDLPGNLSGNSSETSPENPPDDSSLPLSPAIPSDLDPELGILRLRPLADSEPSVIDPELGVLRLRPLAPIPPRRRPVSVAGHISFFSGNNLLARSEPEADDIFQVGVSLRAIPKIGSRTFLISSAEVSTLRYVTNDVFNYNQLELRFGVYHYLTRRMYTDFHWRNQQFFQLDGGDRFLNTHQLRWTLGRTDSINPNLDLNSSYQLRLNWADPETRSRVSNRFRLGLTQEFTPDFKAGLSYQLVLNDYTQQDRYDSYQQLLAQLRYDFSDTTSLAVFGGGRWGDSSNDLLDFDTALLGVSFVVNVPLF